MSDISALVKQVDDAIGEACFRRGDREFVLTTAQMGAVCAAIDALKAAAKAPTAEETDDYGAKCPYLNPECPQCYASTPGDGESK